MGRGGMTTVYLALDPRFQIVPSMISAKRVTRHSQFLTRTYVLCYNDHKLTTIHSSDDREPPFPQHQKMPSFLQLGIFKRTHQHDPTQTQTHGRCSYGRDRWASFVAIHQHLLPRLSRPFRLRHQACPELAEEPLLPAPYYLRFRQKNSTSNNNTRHSHSPK